VHLEPWLAAAGDLLLGSSCHGCGTPWWGVCPSCRTLLRARTPRVTRPDSPPPCFPVTVTCSPYDDLLRGLVSAHKDRGALGLSPLLADRLAQSVHALLTAVGASGPLLLVPVPSAAAAVRRRGFDATLTLARLAARQLKGRHDLRAVALLAQRSGLADQAGLDAAGRRANLDGGLRLRRARPGAAALPPGTSVVLVDDVVTTGASLAEAARVVGAARLTVVGAATVAATERRAPPGAGTAGRR
jgi:predicted amidophosphoribosyltransferase